MLQNAALKFSTSSGYILGKLSQRRCFCATQSFYLNQKWRKEKGLPLNPNACGVLTDGQDYTFLDGKPTPYGVRQKQRIIKQKEIAQKIIELSAEVDFAVDRHKILRQQEDERRQAIISSKLIPKGIELLKKKK